MRESLILDILKQAGSINLMNVPGCIGYVFTTTNGEHAIYMGMYVSIFNEVTFNPWSYFVSYKDDYRTQQMPGGVIHLITRDVKKGHVYKIGEDSSLTDINVNVQDYACKQV